MPWNDSDIENVKGILASGSGRDEVCAVTGCNPSELDGLCRESFGEPYEAIERRYHAVGAAMVRKALFEAACAGNAKAAEMYREDMEAHAKPDGGAHAPNVLELVMADRKSRAAKAE